MSKYRSLILVISISVLFSGLVSAQERVQETRLLAKTGSKGQSLSENGSIPFGHDCGSRFRGPSPEERVLYSSGSGAGSYSRMVTHGPLE